MKEIPGYEGIYACDREGNIFTLHRIIEKKMKSGKTYQWSLPLKKLSPAIRCDGYLQVSLCKDSRKKSCLVHRLIGKTFINNKIKEINHIDGNKKNNAVSNLEETTRSKNLKHAFKLGLRNHKKENHPGYFIDNEIKNRVKRLLECGISQQKIADEIGISQVSVSKIKLNRI